MNIVDLPIKNCDFPQQTVGLPEGKWKHMPFDHLARIVYHDAGKS